MTTRYRVEYALKTHRRDQFIEWIKGLLAVPFVLHSQPTAVYDEGCDATDMVEIARDRYGQIMKDVERLVRDHINHQTENKAALSKLKLLVPSVGTFFTPLRLDEAFLHQDTVRKISSRRFVPPSFNDVRAILNTAQVISLVKDSGVELVTFDGDVTLYDDGTSFRADNPALPCLLRLLKRGIKVGIVTAAGYTDASKYYGRLQGLLDAVHGASELGDLRNNLIVMGGESNFLFKYSDDVPERLVWVERKKWILEEMKGWSEAVITELLDTAEGALKQCIKNMDLPARIVRKDRAVGIIPAVDGDKFQREQLEETVLVTQKILEMSDVAAKIPFCAFNGGNDVFVDIGDKSWGVLVCQRYFGGIEGRKTLHVGDQFLSAGANDFKARLACTTAWIASPAETVALLDEIESFTIKAEKTIGSTSTNGIAKSPISRPVQPASATSMARELLGAPAMPTDGTFDDEVKPMSSSASDYDADNDGASISSRSDVTAIRDEVLQPRSTNGLNGSATSFSPSSSSSTLQKGQIPTSANDHAAWLAQVDNSRMAKYRGKYGAPKMENADTGSNAGDATGDADTSSDGGVAAGGAVPEVKQEEVTW